jgi:hypothetical protein
MGYCYNDGLDPNYGANPPAFGVDFFQGPMVDSPGDTAFLFRGSWFGVDTVYDMKNLPMTAFTFYNNAGEWDSFPSPQLNAPRARLYQEGGYNGHGNPILPPQHGIGGVPGDPPQFFYTGDPEAGTGWRDTEPNDKRFLVNCGPFPMPAWQDLNGNNRPDPTEPGVQDIIMTYLVGQGNDAANSVTDLKRVAELVQYYYDVNFGTVGIEEDPFAVISKFKLLPNYPNPFNPRTTIEFVLPQSSKVTLKIFNILGEEVATLLSASLPSGSYKYEWDATNLASGIYLYRLQAGDPSQGAGQGYVEIRKMVMMR